MKTITIKLRTVLFAALTMLALVCFVPSGSAQQLNHSGYPVANRFAPKAQYAQTETNATCKPGKKKEKKQQAKKGGLRFLQDDTCMGCLFIGWGK